MSGDCPRSQIKQVTVITIYPYFVPGERFENSLLEANAGDDVPACAGSPVILNGLATGGVGAYAYSWTPTEFLDDPSVANPIATVTETTTFVLSVNDDMCAKMDSITIQVIASGNAMFASWHAPYDPSFDINGDQSLDILDQVSLVENCQ